MAIRESFLNKLECEHLLAPNKLWNFSLNINLIFHQLAKFPTIWYAVISLQYQHAIAIPQQKQLLLHSLYNNLCFHLFLELMKELYLWAPHLIHIWFQLDH